MRRARAGAGFGLVDLIFVGLLAATAGALASHFAPPPPPRDVAALRARYGPERHSQFYEEWIIRDFFQDKRGGVFVDVGANHHERFNNTYYLEARLGWSGLAVEPLREFEAGYLQHRPRTRFKPFFVSDRSHATARLNVLPNQPLVSSETKSFTQQWGAGTTELTVPTSTLDDLLDAEGIEAIDLLSMDIELAEPKALAGFSIERFKPALVCIEAHPEVRQHLLDYFHMHGYVVVGKYLEADRVNLYFMPAGSNVQVRQTRHSQ